MPMIDIHLPTPTVANSLRIRTAQPEPELLLLLGNSGSNCLHGRVGNLPPRNPDRGILLVDFLNT